MKRLRLRKLWVVVAIVLLLTPLLSGRLEKTDATAPTQTPTESTPEETTPATGQPRIYFLGDSILGSDMIFMNDSNTEDGSASVQWNLRASDSGGFNVPGTGYIQAVLSFDPVTKEEARIEDLVSDVIEWNYKVIKGSDDEDTEKVVKIDDDPNNSTFTRKRIQIAPRAAGIVEVFIEAQGYNEDPNGTKEIDGKKYSESLFYQNRTIYLASPLQIFDSSGSIVHTYTQLLSDTSTTKVYANNAGISSCNVAWFFVDAETKDATAVEFLELVPPIGGKGLGAGKPIPPKTSLAGYETSKIVEIDGINREQTTSSRGMNIFGYPVAGKGKAGFVRVIGRIYLNNDSTSEVYIEDSFDIMVKPTIAHKSIEIENGIKKLEMTYDQVLDLNRISNDLGNSLQWEIVERDNNSGVIELTSGKKLGSSITSGNIRAQNYGKLRLEATSIYGGYENHEDLKPKVRDFVDINVAATLLKGERERQETGVMEIINIGGTITLSTNVAGSRYKYEWRYMNGATDDGLLLPGGVYDSDSKFKSEGMTLNGSGGDYSAIKITGKKSGEDVKIRCIVKDPLGTSSVSGYSNAIMVKDVIIRIADTMSLSETQKKISVGGSFNLSVISTVDNGIPVDWSIVSDEPGDEECISIVADGDKAAVVTGLKSSEGRWITIMATQELNGTTISAVCKVQVIPGINGAEIIATPSATIPVGGTTELELIIDPEGTNLTDDELIWVLKNKNGTIAEEIIKKDAIANTNRKVTITGLSVGEAYVAVVTNDTTRVEIAVITIRVVSEVQGIEIKGDKVKGDKGNKSVKDYLNPDGTGTCELKYDLLPIGFVEDVEVIWRSNNPDIAEVDEKTGVVTYKAVGTAIITATVAGTAIADTCTIIIENPATGIELNPTSISLRVGETYQLEAKIEPETVTDASLTWESSNPEVATVNNGVIKAVAAGSAIITVRTSNGLEAQCVVTVLVPAEGIELNYYSITVKKGTVFYLSAKITPEGAYDKAVIFESSDEDTVFVEQDGTVTARKVGTVEITVTSKDNPELSAICVVTVVESVSGLTLNSRQETIKVGEQFLLKATVRPSDSLNQEVTFESADPSIATVDENGLITGVKGGVTVIIVKTVERGLMATCTITVQEDIQSITLSETETYLAKGKNKKLTATILPASATKKKLKWTSSDESIVIVDSEGNIHGVNLGEAIITATAQDDGKVSATCKVTVIDATTKITLNQTIIRIMERDTYQLTYTIEPNYASVQRVNWTTSDASVARVDSLGLVTGVGAGEAKIRATAADGSGVYAECTVIVTPIILTTNVRVDSPATTLVVGETRTMTARTQPRNTTEAIRWVSENPSVVTIDSDGNMRAVGPGVAQITAISSVSGIEGTSTITVLGLNATSVTLEQYDTFDLYLDGVDSTVTWFSRNKRIATVTRRGVVTGRREGTTDVVARVGGKLVSCEVNVEKLRK